MIAAREVGEANLQERMAARFGPWDELLRDLVALQIERDGLVEVVELEVHAADDVRRPRHPELVAGCGRIVAHVPIPAKSFLVLALREVCVSQAERRVSDEESLVSPLGELETLAEVPEGALEVGAKREHLPTEDERLCGEARVADLT
jgi:hypothetical protein